jgi:hypothetical protein
MIQDNVPAGSCGMDLLARMQRLMVCWKPDVELKDPETRKGDKREVFNECWRCVQYVPSII